MLAHLQDLSVLILGLGTSGLSMARWCSRFNARISVLDTRADPPGLQSLKTLPGHVAFAQADSFTAAMLSAHDVRLVCRSPGLLPSQIADLTHHARSVGVPVWGELDLFVQALAELEQIRGYRPKILAVTGTNGKTTVTSLTGHLVARAGLSVCVAGNIGPTLLDTLAACLDTDRLPEVWVLELSSFQLDGVKGFMPTMGTVLNLTQDHLDWHETMIAYCEAKSRVFGPHKAGASPMLLNRDDPLVMAMQPLSLKAKEQREVVSFGSDMPKRPGDYGIELMNGMSWLVRAMPQEEPTRAKKGVDREIVVQRLLPADALRIRGRHNALNALASLALANAAGCSLAPILYGLREYAGEPHRVQPVAVINGVEYLDDSKGTNVGATVAALKGVGEDKHVILILGGVGKGQDFSSLMEPVRQYAKAVILIGRDAALIRAALGACEKPLHDSASMPEAVALAADLAGPGDAVLLSPACASFDMFNDYVHRAQVFVRCVQLLASEAGAL